MKHIYFIALLFIPFTWNAQIGLVSNGDFESWAVTNLGQSLDNYQSSNEDSPGVTTCSRSSDAVHLNYSVLMETQTASGDTLFGWIANGNIDAMTGGDSHTTNIDSVTIRLKYDIMAGDSATLLLIQHGGPLPMFDAWKLTGTQSSWVTMSFPVNSVAHDTVIFAAASGNAFLDFSIAGSWLQIDYVELVNDGGANEDMTNNSFENWTDIDYEDPTGWKTYNEVGAIIGIIPTSKSTNAHSGTYAASLNVFEFNGDTVNSILTNGYLNVNFEPIGGPAYASMPSNFEGAYQWNPVGANDSAWIYIEFTNVGSFVGGNYIALGTSDATTGSYQTFDIPTNLFGTPDTMIIIVYTEASPNANLLVDAFQLTGNGVGIDEIFTTVYHVYPNPAKDVINVSGASPSTLLEIYSLDGKLVESVRGTNIDVSAISGGIYHLKIDRKVSQKIIVAR